MDDVRDKLTDSSVAAGDMTTGGAAPGAEPLDADRRRPGRINPVPPSLVPLLRGHSSPTDTDCLSADLSAALPDETIDDIDGARMFAGIVIGTLLATPFWLLLGIVLWWALR